MQDQKYSDRMTLITLISALIGFLSLTVSPFIISLYALIIIIPWFWPLPPHSPIKVASLTATTLLFGMINGFTFIALKQYFRGQETLLPIFSIYLSMMTVYHYFEFQLINNFHYRQLVWHSFLIYHSKPYFLANLFSLTQHLLTRYLFAFNYKLDHPLIIPALLVAVLGETLRILAFFTCKNNFTHVVRFRKVREHQLITHGVYSFFRHPSYTGYFYFSVASQIFLGNILSSFAFFYVLSNFFNERIQFQEEALLGFFPQYLYYKKKTHILIPFVQDPDFNQKYDPVEKDEHDAQ